MKFIELFHVCMNIRERSMLLDALEHEIYFLKEKGSSSIKVGEYIDLLDQARDIKLCELSRTRGRYG